MKSVAILLTAAAGIASAPAATTIDPANSYAYGANIGWVNFAGDTANGAVIGEYVCSGSVYAANVGWISLGSGSPANRIGYQNNSAGDFGVNHDGLGNLRGLAYGANIGWVNFENVGAPKVDLLTGNLSGYVYSVNCGWLSLSNAAARVRTTSIAPGAKDSNGFPIAWELMYFGQLGIDPNADTDGDGASNWQEYVAGTNPFDNAKWLNIQRIAVAQGGTSVTVQWSSEPNRYYYIQKRSDLLNGAWVDSGFGLIRPDGPSTSRTLAEAGAGLRLYRIQAVRPLMP